MRSICSSIYADVNVEHPVHSLEVFLENIEKEVIQRMLEVWRWNKTAAAKRFRISSCALRYRLKKLDLNQSAQPAHPAIYIRE